MSLLGMFKHRNKLGLHSLLVPVVTAKLIIIISILLSGCSGGSFSRDDRSRLPGILVTEFHSNSDDVVLSLVKMDGSDQSNAEIQLHAEDNFRVMSLAPGKYTWREINLGKSGVTNIRGEYDFIIDSGKLNYIGDVLLKVSGDKVKISFINQATVVQERLATEFSALYQRYPFVEHITEKVDD